ncbi:hypothetical protein P255_00456 [Acinetobacter brisouii CIP 110357]|uniref:Uncharacterized protein n=1 Tax=Acinetobacter brisouii CIP 110357 TaxID=1341683 RepID=V2UUJ2_9GAMM|nr:hypothetical protein [Acinetobacter brisouii]ENV46317.1 hypothetical protein F954_02296 [Acinetobacter brisouii ANC 4119]ESK52305.1 hypothetical protein P255_00456 [Acinetobacter brisouii CIP 110357]
MKRLVALLALCCCNHSFAWDGLERANTNNKTSGSLGGLVGSAIMDLDNKYTRNKRNSVAKVEHQNVKNTEDKFRYLVDITRKLDFSKLNKNYTNIDSLRSIYLMNNRVHSETLEMKETIVSMCFAQDINVDNEGSCFYDFYISKNYEHQLKIQQDQEEAQRLAAQKQAEQAAIRKRTEYKKQLAKGIPKTEYNIRRYCQASANIVVDAYVNAALQAQVGASSPRFNRANEELLNITPTQEKKLIMIVSDDAERAILLSRDYMLQNTHANEYATKCFANPKTMIINYYEIFKN